MDTRETGNGPYSDLQQLAAAAVKSVGFDFRGCYPPNQQLSSLLRNHADDPTWFPVKFKKGDWVDCDRDELCVVVGQSCAGNPIVQSFLNAQKKIVVSRRLQAVDNELLGMKFRRLTDKQLGSAIREHFKP